MIHNSDPGRAGYVDALNSRLGELLTSLEEDQKQAKILNERIDQKQQQIQYVQKLLTLEGVNVGNTNTNSTIADAAYNFLKRRSKAKPFYYKDLAKLILQEGKTIPGKDPAANLIAHLGRDERFTRTGRGLYALKEWGLKSTKRPKKRKKKKTN